MQPRKDVFARDYIAETVAAYARAVSVAESSADSDEIRWAHDVLQEFFRVTGSDPVLDKARRDFDALPKPVASGASRGPAIIRHSSFPTGDHRNCYRPLRLKR